MTRKTGTLHEDQNTFMIISRSVILIMRYVWYKIGREHQNTHFIFNNAFCFSKIVPFYEMKLKNVLEPDMPQMTIPRMRIACWLTKATDTHIDYVILIAFYGNDDYATVTYVTCVPIAALVYQAM